MGPSLDGITVVSIEQAISAPLCTRHLAELGARVIKVERPHAGDSTRTYDDHVLGMSSHFVWLNRGKESVELDLRQAGDLSALKALIAGADVFVSNMAPGALERLGLSFEELSSIHPELIILEISGFGEGGPLSHKRAYDLLIQAESGICSLTGAPGFPVKPGVPSVDIGTALYALSATLGALFERTRTGRGKVIKLAMFDVAAEMTGYAINEVIHTGTQPPSVPLGNAAVSPYGAYRTLEGHKVVLAATSQLEFERLARDLLGQETLINDPRFQTNAARVEHCGELDEVIERWTRTQRLTEIQEKADAIGIANARLNDVADVINHEHLAARDRWERAEIGGTTVKVLKSPLVGDHWPNAASARVPVLGENNDVVTRNAVST